MNRILMIALLLSMASCMPVKPEDGAQKLPNEHMKKCHGRDHHHNSRADHKRGCSS